jgi:hypothetical protein
MMKAFQLTLPVTRADYVDSQTSDQSHIWEMLTYLFVSFNLLQLHTDYCDSLNDFVISDKKN